MVIFYSYVSLPDRLVQHGVPTMDEHLQYFGYLSDRFYPLLLNWAVKNTTIPWTILVKVTVNIPITRYPLLAYNLRPA